jgi:hypothetical protein
MPARLNFRRHFLALALALALVLALSYLQLFPEAYLAGFAIYGALHATALVVAVRSQHTLAHRGLFVVLASGLNILVLYLGIGSIELLSSLPATGRLYGALGLCSLMGALTYGLLIRNFFFAALRPRRIAQIGLTCLVASLLSLAAENSRVALGNWWFVAVWWTAFSSSLWLMQRRFDVLGAQAHA